jgi:hypothetical protein
MRPLSKTFFFQNAQRSIGETARWLRSGEYRNNPRIDRGNSLNPIGSSLNNTLFNNNRNEDRLNPGLGNGVNDITLTLLQSMMQLLQLLIGQLGQGIGTGRRTNADLIRPEYSNVFIDGTQNQSTGLQTGILNNQPFVATPFVALPVSARFNGLQGNILS